MLLALNNRANSEGICTQPLASILSLAMHLMMKKRIYLLDFEGENEL